MTSTSLGSPGLTGCSNGGREYLRFCFPSPPFVLEQFRSYQTFPGTVKASNFAPRENFVLIFKKEKKKKN
jgi:hypothetical protein